MEHNPPGGVPGAEFEKLQPEMYFLLIVNPAEVPETEQRLQGSSVTFVSSAVGVLQVTEWVPRRRMFSGKVTGNPNSVRYLVDLEN